MLLQKGDVYGKQFVVFESYQAYPMYVVTYTCPDDFTPQLTAPRTQRPLKWEHKTKSEKTWQPYSSEHSMQLFQALRAKEQLVILEQDGNALRVDLHKLEQKPVVQRFPRRKRRQVRYFPLNGHSS